jgi:hypothetical protein
MNIREDIFPGFTIKDLYELRDRVIIYSEKGNALVNALEAINDAIDIRTEEIIKNRNNKLNKIVNIKKK